MRKKKETPVQISDEERYNRLKWLQSIGRFLDERQFQFVSEYEAKQKEEKVLREKRERKDLYG